MAKKSTWEENLKEMLRREHGAGWRLREQSGKAQLTQLLTRGSGPQKRRSGDLGIEWRASKQTEILNAVGRVVELVGGGRSLAETLKLLKKAPATAEGDLDWAEVAKQYEAHRVGSGQVTQRNYDTNSRYRIDHCLTLLNKRKGAPCDGPSLMRAYTTAHLLEMASGGEGRRRNLTEVARFLKFAVQKCGGSQQWLPVEGDDLRDLIGVRTDPKEATVPVKPEQLLGLLESLEGKPELRLAVALVGLFGLRPGELLAIEARDGDLFVGDIKRNRYSAAKPKEQRLAMPLDLKELPGEGARVVAQFESGLVQLPTSIRNAKDFKACGHSFGQYLRRHNYWQHMLAKTAGLTPYGFRHGFAWRGSLYYDRQIPYRALAKSMGHDPNTHLNYYGKFADQDDVKAAFNAITRSLVAA